MSEETLPPLSWKDRLVAASFYCGAPPLAALLQGWRGNPYLEHHYRQALCVILAFLAVSGGSLLTWTILSVLLVSHREWYVASGIDPIMIAAIRRSFIVWLAVWLVSTGWALTGSWGIIPLLGRLARWDRLMRVTLVAASILAVAVLTVSAAGVHAHFLTRADTAPAKAYMLYDDLEFFPRWLFTLGFYPITVTATAKWGGDSVVVAPFTPDNLAKAIEDGSFIFVSSHGNKKGLFKKEVKITPADAAPHGVSSDLQYVYLTGCESGTLAREWKQALAPAEVVTFDRLSTILEHIIWLVFRGAGKIAELK